jgi:hypothetical protein
MFHEMSEAQRLVLRAAAARADRLVQPPTNARGAAATAIAGKLIGAGWAKEMRALNGAPIWRRDAASGSVFTLKLTAKGLEAVAGQVRNLPARPRPRLRSFLKKRRQKGLLDRRNISLL